MVTKKIHKKLASFNMQLSTLRGGGFTLIETVVGIALFIVLALGVVALVSVLLTTVRQQGGLLADSDSARKVAFGIVSELRNASNSSVGAYALSAAGDQTITFYSNVDGGSDVERVRYYIQNGSLYRAVLKPTGSPYVYNAANEVVTEVQKNVANGANRLFYYYDGTYNGVTDNFLSQPITLTSVKYVKIRLQIYNKAGVKNQTSFTVTAGGSIRGLKNNLGN